VKNIIPIFRWAEANGEAKIVDRILVKLLPEMLTHGQKLTTELINQTELVEVPIGLYQAVLNTAEELVGQSFE
jgi:hypothetical protein